MTTTKLLTAICLITITIAANATVRTVSNLGGSQYSTLNAAYTAAVNGDTIMIEGSATIYNGVTNNTWEKSLTVIGPGYNANKQNFTPATLCTYCNGINLQIGVGASGSKFFGIGTDNISGGGGIGVQFHDCIIGQIASSNTGNWTFKNCVFYGTGTNINLNGGSSTNLFLSNCIFNGSIYYDNTPIANFIIDHCLFLKSSGPVLSSINTNAFCARNTVVRNCIFMNATSLIQCNGGGLSFLNCVSRNNLSTAGVTTVPGLAFANYTNGSNWSTAHDYHCTDAAVVNMGDDGTDIGLHGGTANFSEKGEPLNVNVVRVINVAGAAPPNGTLNVTITAGKPTDQ